MTQTERKKLCMWCEGEAITTVVHIPACRTHHDEYHRRRQSGEDWDAIHHDFWRQRWTPDAVNRAIEAWDARERPS